MGINVALDEIIPVSLNTLPYFACERTHRFDHPVSVFFKLFLDGNQYLDLDPYLYYLCVSFHKDFNVTLKALVH